MAFMFFPDRTRVLREIARVVGSGGIVAFSVPARLDAQPAYAPFVAMAVRHAGPEAAGLLSTYFASGDLDELRGLADAAGLQVTAVRTYRGRVRCPSIDAFVATEVESTPLRERISDEVYGRIRADARELLRPFTSAAGAAEIPLDGHVIAACPRADRVHYRPMRVGVLVPTRGVVMHSARRPPAEACWAMARLADGAGYDALWVGDSIVAKPRLEPLTTLAHLAGITTRVRLGTAVLLPALRHPVVLAGQIANVDQLSRGRLVLGLGVGWSLPSAEREWAACGADHSRRVRRLEEHVEVWRLLWRGEPVSRRGDDWELTEHTIGPLPWTAAGPPVLITAGNRGELLPAQLDRFARLGDGIITTYVDADECRRLRECAEAALARRGRAAPAFPLCVYTTVRMDDDRRRAERLTTEFLATYYGGGVHSRGTMGLGPADVVVEALRSYAAAGVTDLCVRFAGDDQVPQLERFTHEALPHLQTPP
jgi:alkanesulfonate monooxygenase SsuD/methylene tetrahydromethanopterin reductase-like flavin-dependent oxidoreductase (luciferase family)